MLRLVEQYKTLEFLAEQTGSSAAHLSQIKNGKSMGGRVARRFEERLQLPKGWMDQQHSPTSESPLTMQAIADFEALPPAFQKHIANKMRELRAYAECLPEYIRSSLQRPDDPAKWRDWELQVEADMALRLKAPGKSTEDSN